MNKKMKSELLQALNVVTEFYLDEVHSFKKYGDRDAAAKALKEYRRFDKIRSELEKEDAS